MLKILFFSYSFIAFILGKKKFSFRGCRWKAINPKKWSQEHQDWILIVDNLFTQIFGDDYLNYTQITHPYKQSFGSQSKVFCVLECLLSCQLMIRWLVLEVVGLGSSWLPETSSKIGQKLSTISSGDIPICITTERNSCCRF